MKRTNELVSKYLKKNDARVLPDGSPHPDDLREAEHLATIEFLESLEVEPPEDLPSLTDREAMKSWIEMAQRFGYFDTVLDFIAHAVNKHDAQVRNAPTNPGRLPDARTLKRKLDGKLASGLTRSSAIEILADDYDVEPDSIRKCLLRGGYRAKE